MKASVYSWCRSYFFTGSAVIILCILFFFIGDGEAQSVLDQKASKEKIVITSQSLTADDNKKFAEFIGKVKAVQGDTTITSDRLKIYYQGKKDKAGKEMQDSIKKIVASGSVNIQLDDMTAESRKAVYTTADRILVLSGPDSSVTRPESGTISGSKIIVERDTGKIRFEGGVKGTFIPGDKGLD